MTPPPSCSTRSTALACGPGVSATRRSRRSTAISRPSTTGAALPSSGRAIPPAAPALRLATPATRARTTTSCRPAETLTRLTPLITWKPLSGRQSYFVIVSKDANFSNIVDYAFTQVPAYSPRNSTRPTTYSDETTLFYWAVLPATSFNGSGAASDPLSAAASNFQKQSIPPAAISPANGALLTVQPIFRWTQVEGARRYRFQVAQEPTFAAPLEDVTTAATSYTPFATHPADTTLYWRVRADDENLIGLNWSAVRTFQRRLPTPTPSAGNATSGDFTPCLDMVERDRRIRLHVRDGRAGRRAPGVGQHADACHRLRLPLRPGHLALASPRRVPEDLRLRHGPWSSYVPFTRTLGEPSGATTSVSGNHVLLSWNWKLGAKDFDVQISQRPDFATTIEDVTTDNTSYAPLLQHFFYVNGGSFYWRVAARDKNFNVGDWTQPQRIDIAQRLRVAVNRTPPRRRWSRVLVTVSDPSGKAVARASVRVTGRRDAAEVGSYERARQGHPPCPPRRSADGFCSARRSRDLLRAPCRCASGRALRSGRGRAREGCLRAGGAGHSRPRRDGRQARRARPPRRPAKERRSSSSRRRSYPCIRRRPGRRRSPAGATIAPRRRSRGWPRRRWPCRARRRSASARRRRSTASGS